MGALVPILIPLLAKVVDKVFGAGKGKEVKLPALQTILEALFKPLAKEGISLPGGDELTTLIETFITSMNKKGELQGHETILPVEGIDMDLMGIAVMLLKKAGVKGI